MEAKMSFNKIKGHLVIKRGYTVAHSHKAKQNLS